MYNIYQIHSNENINNQGKGDRRTYWLVGKEGFSKPLPERPADG